MLDLNINKRTIHLVIHRNATLTLGLLSIHYSILIILKYGVKKKKKIMKIMLYNILNGFIYLK